MQGSISCILPAAPFSGEIFLWLAVSPKHVYIDKQVYL
jgi:hypothetical protein